MRIHIRRPGVVALALLVSGVCASSATAAARPDLKVGTLANPAASAAPGGTLAVSLTVVNGGARRAKASRTQVLLSLDRKGDANAIKLGSVAVHSLKRHGKVRVTRSLAILAQTPPGRYHVIACADV